MKKSKHKADKNMPLKDSIRGAITQPQSEVRGSRQHHILSISLILIISIAIYSNTLKNGFVYDDEFTVVNNTLIKNFSNISKLFTKEYFAASGEMSYRPVVTFTYFIDYALYGLKPYGYHLTNLLLHALNGVILYIFLTLCICSKLKAQSNYFQSSAFSLLSALIFVTHPVLTEAVNAISFREDLLCFLFFISALIIHIYPTLTSPYKGEESKVSPLLCKEGSGKVEIRKWRSFLYALSCFLYLLALLSKEMAITFPLIIFLYEWIYGRKIESPQTSPPLQKGRVRVGSLFNPYTISYILITIFYLYLRFFLFHNPVEENIQIWSFSERLMTIPYLILKHLLLLIAPVSLSADYVITPIKSLSSPIFIFSSLLLISLFIMTHIFGRKDKGISFGILFFLILLIPVYNIFPLSNPLAERYIYLPLTGFIVITFSIIQNISIKHKTKRFYMPIFFILIIGIYSLLVVKRNVIWRDNYSLWYKTVKKIPESSRAHNNLGNIYFREGRTDEAINEYLTALKLEPDSTETHYNLGNIYFREGRTEEAINEYLTALKLETNLTKVYKNLGIAYSKQGRLDEAIRAYLTALKLRPDDAGGYFNLGFTYFKQGRLNEAIRAYQTVLRLRPDFVEAHYNLGLAYFKQGQFDEAIRAYLSTLKLIPDDFEVHYNLGIAYWKKGLEDKAYKELEIALKLQPDYLPAKQALESLRRN